jgi:hypothetical protein
MMSLATKPPKEGTFEKFGVKAIGLGSAMLA